MAYVLDTNVITALRYGNTSVITRIGIVPKSDVFVTIVSFEEEIKGQFEILATHNKKLSTNRKGDAALLIPTYRELSRIVDFYGSSNVLPYDDAAARIDNDLRRALLRLRTQDRRIAAITLAAGATLVTRNTVDFQGVPRLNLEDWFVS